jgi:predicted transposase/invertase (TIGR01784 family)
MAEETGVAITRKAKQKVKRRLPRQLRGTTVPMGVKEILMERRKKEGIEIGEYQKALEIAFELKKEGLALDFIARITKLTIEEIEEL